MFSFGEFVTCLNSLIIKKALMNKFGTTSLYGKIVLSKSYFRFAGVAVLRHKITGIASHHNIIYLTLTAFTYLDHFAGIRKMISYRLPCI